MVVLFSDVLCVRSGLSVRNVLVGVIRLCVLYVCFTCDLSALCDLSTLCMLLVVLSGASKVFVLPCFFGAGCVLCASLSLSRDFLVVILSMFTCVRPSPSYLGYITHLRGYIIQLPPFPSSDQPSISSLSLSWFRFPHFSSLSLFFSLSRGQEEDKTGFE